MIKALAVALMDEPKCNVMYTPTELVTFKRADISVAVRRPPASSLRSSSAPTPRASARSPPR
jgi:pyruvate/2-oxoglutarate dehydrogenase complex dihydrolipoamide acyltransferase (E2) component